MRCRRCPCAEIDGDLPPRSRGTPTHSTTTRRSPASSLGSWLLWAVSEPGKNREPHGTQSASTACAPESWVFVTENPSILSAAADLADDVETVRVLCTSGTPSASEIGAI